MPFSADGAVRGALVICDVNDIQQTFGCSAPLAFASFFPMGSFPLLTTFLPLIIHLKIIFTPYQTFFAALFLGIFTKFSYFFLFFSFIFLRKFFQKFPDRNQDLETINICLFVSDDYSLTPILTPKSAKNGIFGNNSFYFLFSEKN